MAYMTPGQIACDRGDHDTHRSDVRYEGTCIRCGRPRGYSVDEMIEEAVEEAVERALKAKTATG